MCLHDIGYELFIIAKFIVCNEKEKGRMSANFWYNRNLNLRTSQHLEVVEWFLKRLRLLNITELFLPYVHVNWINIRISKILLKVVGHEDV